VVDFSINPTFQFRDKDTLPPQDLAARPAPPRVVPGGTTVRRGAYLGRRVIIVPPSFVNVGAYVDDESLVDSHVLVGSCAQVGKRVHLSAGVQLGGVLEPIGALPVIIEDDTFVGAQCGIFEGTVVSNGTVLGAGVILTRGTPVFDLVHEKTYRAAAGEPLVIPERAVVVPGARPAKGDFAREHGLSLQTPVIVRYREPGESSTFALEATVR
jgi:2,3,4,5-tetrahydropyridine-2-carboxylate N-succinyltransferase